MKTYLVGNNEPFFGHAMIEEFDNYEQAVLYRGHLIDRMFSDHIAKYGMECDPHEILRELIECVYIEEHLEKELAI